ncbi:MAG: hypothetical protein AAGK14_14810 [Verrucomicrobiota bacterium]
MNKLKMLGFALGGLWMVVLATYAAQISAEDLESARKLVPLNEASCSSSSGNPE